MLMDGSKPSGEYARVFSTASLDCSKVSSTASLDCTRVFWIASLGASAAVGKHNDRPITYSRRLRDFRSKKTPVTHA